MKKIIITVLLIVLVITAGTAGFIAWRNYQENKAFEAATPPDTLFAELVESFRAQNPAVVSINGTVQLCTEGQSSEQEAVLEALRTETEIEVISCSTVERRAEAKVVVRGAEADSLAEAVKAAMNTELAQRVEEASKSSEIYDENLQYRSEVVEAAYADVWEKGLPDTEVATGSVELTAEYSYNRQTKAWETDFSFEALPSVSAETVAEEIRENALSGLPYIRKHYTIEESATVAPAPDQSCYGESENPEDVQAVIDSPLAQQLIGDQTLVWNKDIDFIPGVPIRWYLDETILAIEWQEPESKAYGTFMEIVVQDGSQIRRKIAGDSYCGGFNLGTILSEQANAVVASGGDLYYHQRNCGIVVYDREIYRFDNVTCDTCYINTAGDMLFSYRNQFSDISEAESFVEENDILFSLCFGPVLVDNGKDVTPYQYTWGEINEEYARAALGQLGQCHYLTMNINCKAPNYYYLVTLRQAADAMIRRGCINAYALDGGQTACTIVNNELINPVQFGEEKVTTDILYFATALPE